MLKKLKMIFVIFPNEISREEIPLGVKASKENISCKKKLASFMKRCKSILKNYMFKESSKDFTIDLHYDGLFTM
jgi:hypothetical protein